VGSPQLAAATRDIDIATTMSYIACPSCGETALRVATRCPHCGLDFGPGVIPPEEPNRWWRLWLAAGAVVAAVVVYAVARNPRQPPVAPPELPVAEVAPPIAARPSEPARDSAVDSTPTPAAVTPQPAPPPAVPAGDQLQRYSATWVNVRERRSPNAASVRVLEPGEAILVDSLVGGWYRVVIDGQAIGYAYRSNLGERAP